MLIHETAFTEASCYRLTQTHDLDGHTVRVRVHRDFYLHQSWAVADVLTPALTWTELTTAPAQDWHPDTHTPRITAHAAAARDTLQPIASDSPATPSGSYAPAPPRPGRPGSICPRPPPTRGQAPPRRPAPRHTPGAPGGSHPSDTPARRLAPRRRRVATRARRLDPWQESSVHRATHQAPADLTAPERIRPSRAPNQIGSSPMTATTTAPRPTPAPTGATPTRTASTRTARTTRGNGRRNTTPPTETTEAAVAGAGPAAGSEQRVHAALSAGGDLTVGALAEATGLGRSTVSKALTRLEAAGRAVRTTIGSSGRARQPDRWNPTTTPTTPTTTNAASPPSPADTPQAQPPQALPETPVGSGPGTGAAAGEGPRPAPARKGRTRRPSTHDTLTTSSPSDGPTSPPLAPTGPPEPSGPGSPEEGAQERMNPKSGTARLAPGALTQLVADHYGRHPGVPLTSGEVGRALGRSGGAVRNAADKLVGDGALRLLDGAPRRYTTTD